MCYNELQFQDVQPIRSCHRNSTEVCGTHDVEMFQLCNMKAYDTNLIRLSHCEIIANESLVHETKK